MPEPHNELGYGDVDARPDMPDATPGMAGGGESGGGARPSRSRTPTATGRRAARPTRPIAAATTPTRPRGDGGDAQ